MPDLEVVCVAHCRADAHPLRVLPDDLREVPSVHGELRVAEVVLFDLAVHSRQVRGGVALRHN